MLESGVKPVYVFDGKAPELKGGELAKRKERRKEAEKGLANADTVEDAEKFSKRLVRVTKQHNDDCKQLLKLLGCPIVCAPSEAEAQCAQLCKENLVYGIATEDMDGLTFGTPRLIRNLSSGRPDEKAKEYALDKVLSELKLTQDQFIDLCILMGCDYCPSIKGIGGKKGLELIRKFGSIEEILKQKFDIHNFVDVELSYYEKQEPAVDIKDEANVNEEKTKKDYEGDDQKMTKTDDDEEQENKPELKKEVEEVTKNDSVAEDDFIVDDDEEEEDENKLKSKKKSSGLKKIVNPVPDNWLFRGARQLFKMPNVLRNEITEEDLKFTDVDEEGLIKFLCEENGFSEARVRPAIGRVKASKKKANQSRIDTFFKVVSTHTAPKTPNTGNKKRSSTGQGSQSKRGRKPR